MKTLSLMAVSLLFLTLCLSSCKKDSDKSKTELLTQSAWIQTNSETLTGGVYVSNWAIEKACDKDDLWIYKPDKNFQLTEGPSRCDPTEPDIIYAGVWAFNADETAIVIDNIFRPIITLNEQTLVVTYFSGTLTHRETYGH